MEDEWERAPESEESLDLLFVSFEEAQVTIDKMLDTIKEQGFEAEVRE